MEQRISTPAQQQWLAKLLGFHFQLEYKKGSSNLVANALSRRDEEVELHVMSLGTPEWIQELQDSYDQEEDLKHLLEDWTAGNLNERHYKLEDGLLYHKKRLVVGANSALKRAILKEGHDSPGAGHTGFLRTYQNLKRWVHWKGLTSDVKSYIKACDSCQRNKADNTSPALPIPEAIWEDISMDFIDGLPPVKGYSVVMVIIVDRLSKYAHFLPLRHPYTADTAAQQFVNSIVKLHGLPRSIVSDRDPIFAPQFLHHYLRFGPSFLTNLSST